MSHDRTKEKRPTVSGGEAEAFVPPLHGLLVVDMSRILTGPYAAMMLGDLGARVIKVEKPGSGDETRSWGPPFIGEGSHRTSTYFLSVNRNKESIALDLRKQSDIRILEGLIRRADVLVENFRTGVMDRLGLSFDRMHQLNQKLIILSITGFGHDGPDWQRPGYDQIVQGEAGLMSMTGPDEEHPTRIGVPISDLLAGMFGAYGVLAALHRRNETGTGEVVRTSLLSSSVAAHVFQGTRSLIAHENPVPMGNAHPTLVPYQTFPCRDGLIQIAVGNDEAWRRCAPLLGLEPDDERFRTNASRVANKDQLVAKVEKALGQETVELWLKEFATRGIPAGRIKSLDEVYADPQALSQGAVLELQHRVLGNIRVPGCPIRLDGTPVIPHQAPPLLDEQGQDIRRWLEDGLADNTCADS